MKNVHVLPTDEPTYLYKFEGKLYLSEKFEKANKFWNNQNIYITSDEEIKDCCVLNTYTNEVYFLEGYYGIQPITKKIILTTDPQLIADGVQPIDDTFLEWFIKNPSCDEVEVGYGWIRLTETDNEGYWVSIPNKQFEMQQEEHPKQEPTLEEAAEKYMIEKYRQGTYLGKLFIDGAKWQAERMYSEVVEFAEWCDDMGYTQVANSFWKSLNDEKGKTTKELFEQYKKK